MTYSIVMKSVVKSKHLFTPDFVAKRETFAPLPMSSLAKVNSVCCSSSLCRQCSADMFSFRCDISLSWSRRVRFESRFTYLVSGKRLKSPMNYNSSRLIDSSSEASNNNLGFGADFRKMFLHIRPLSNLVEHKSSERATALLATNFTLPLMC